MVQEKEREECGFKDTGYADLVKAQSEGRLHEVLDSRSLFEIIVLDPVVKCKNYITRTMSYLGILNSFMILLTFKKLYNIQINAVYLVIIGLIAVLIIGMIDYLLILPREYKHINKQNDMMKKINRIEELIQKK